MRRAARACAYAVFVARCASAACTDCCIKAGHEAYYSCREYEIIVPDYDCNIWRDKAVQRCEATCGDCAMIAIALRLLCEETSRGMATPSQIRDNCDITVTNYETARCHSVCVVTSADCTALDAVDCQYCGNWQNCDCYAPFGSDQHVCLGQGALPGAANACSKMPLPCYSHLSGTSCGAYRWCMINLCVLQDIKCPTTSVCHKISTCLPETGVCKPIFIEDGTPCETSMFYSIPLSGRCVRGECEGLTNECCKSSIKCVTDSPCVKPVCSGSSRECQCSPCQNENDPDYVCDPLCDELSGFCKFQYYPDGSPCTTNRLWIHNEACYKGVCLGTEVDLCMDLNLDCNDPPQCHLPGTCDPHVGECVYPQMDGEPCDDKSNDTFHDVCVEGFCRSSFFDQPKYDAVGEGICTDANRGTINQFHAVDLSHAECASNCSEDVTCEAYSWGMFMHTCTLYSRIRILPRDGWWVEESMFDHGSVGVISTASQNREGAPITQCYKKVAVPAAIDTGPLLTPEQQFWLITVAISLCMFGSVVFARRRKIRDMMEIVDSQFDQLDFSSQIHFGKTPASAKKWGMFSSKRKANKTPASDEVKAEFVLEDAVHSDCHMDFSTENQHIDDDRVSVASVEKDRTVLRVEQDCTEVDILE